MNFKQLNFQNQYNPYSYVVPVFQGFQSFPQEFNPFSYQLFYPNFNILQQNVIGYDQVLLPNSNLLTGQIVQEQKQRKKQSRRLKNCKQISQIQQSQERRLMNMQKSLHYFDPSEAPRVTSIRKQQQIQRQLLLSRPQELINIEQQSDKDVDDQNSMLMSRIHIVLSQPSKDDYPFIIYRNHTKKKQKRRYSDKLFAKRAYYIRNKMKIPFDCQPKARSKSKNQQYMSNQNGDSSDNFELNLQKNQNFEDNFQEQDLVQKQENSSQYFAANEFSMLKPKFYEFQKSNERSINVNIKLQES